MILYEWEPAHAILRTVLVGPVSADDMRQHLDKMARAHMFGRAELIDARGTSGPPPAVTELWSLAEHARRLTDGLAIGPRAIVVESFVDYWVARIFSNFMSGPMKIEVFRSEAEARQWLTSQSSGAPEGNGSDESAAPAF